MPVMNVTPVGFLHIVTGQLIRTEDIDDNYDVYPEQYVLVYRRVGPVVPDKFPESDGHIDHGVMKLERVRIKKKD